MDTNGLNFESELVSYDTRFSILDFDIRTENKTMHRGSHSTNSLGKKSNRKVKIMLWDSWPILDWQWSSNILALRALFKMSSYVNLHERNILFYYPNGHMKQIQTWSYKIRWTYHGNAKHRCRFKQGDTSSMISRTSEGSDEVRWGPHGTMRLPPTIFSIFIETRHN